MGKMKSLKGLVIFAIICLSLTISVSAADIHVATTGNDSYAGTEMAPYKTVQKACDVVNPGDTIIIDTGVYFESVTMTRPGTASDPVTIKAKNGGLNDVIITGADESIRKNLSGNIWTLEDEALQLYSAPLDLGPNPLTAEGQYTATSLPNFPARVIVDGLNLQPYNNLEGLKKFEVNEGVKSYSPYAKDNGAPSSTLVPSEYLRGAENGYFYDWSYSDPSQGRIYVRLNPEGLFYNQENYSPNPNTHTVSASPTLYHRIIDNEVSYSGWRGSAIGENSYNLGIEIPDDGDAFIIIDGLTFETPGYAGVYVGDSEVTIQNVYFRGCRAGVAGAAKYTGDQDVSENVVIKNCDYTQYPTYEEGAWAVDKYYQDPKTIENKFFWWQKKGVSANNNIYEFMDYETGGFTSKMGHNWIIENNNIYSCFDGFSYVSFVARVDPDDFGIEIPSNGVIIRNNIMKNCIDNAIELENHAYNVEIYNNKFIDNFMTISVQPLNGTPWPTNINIYDNLFTSTEAHGKLWLDRAKYSATWLKFGMNGDQWEWCDWIEEVDDGTYYVPAGGKKLNYNVDKIDIVFQEDGVNIFNNTVITPYQYFLEDTSSGEKLRYTNFDIKNNIFLVHLNSGTSRGMAKGNNGVNFAGNIISPTQYRVFVQAHGPATNGYATNNPAALMLDENFLPKQYSPAIGRGVSIPGYKADGCNVGAVLAPFEVGPVE